MVFGLAKIPMRFWPAISAVLLAISFGDPLSGVLVFIGLVPLIFYVYRQESRKEIIYRCWLAGFLYFALVLRWFLAAAPAEWAGIENPAVGLALVLFVWLGSSMVLGFTFAVFGFAASFLIQKNQRDLIVIPALFALSQYLGAWLFSFWSWGPGATLGPHWTFGNIGYPLVDTPLAYWSRLGGLYALGFIAAFFNTVFALFIFKHKTVYAYFRTNLAISYLLFAVFSAVLVSPLIYYRYLHEQETPGPEMEAILVQTNYGNFYTQSFRELLDQKRNSGELIKQPDIIVFPEGLGIFSYVGEDENQLLRNIFPDQVRPGLIITGSTGISEFAPEENQRSNFVIYRNQVGGLLDRQEKTFLIPTGEFLPGLLGVLLNISGNSEIIAAYNQKRTLAPGQGPEQPVEFGGYSVGTLACSGVVSPPLYRGLAQKGASILVNSASHGIFGGSKAAFSQIEGWARFQAIANARPFLQASRGGLSYAIDADGNIIKETYAPGVDLLPIQIQPRSDKAPYTRFGDVPVLVVFGAILFFACLRRLPGYKRGANPVNIL